MKKMRTIEDRLLDTLIYIPLILFGFSILYPFWSQLMESFSNNNTTMGLKLLPVDFTFEAYKNVFAQRTIATAYMNTLFRTSLGTGICVIVTFCAAYPLSRKKLPFNRIMTMLVVFTMFFGGGLIPEYMLVQKLNLIDARMVLVLPSVVSGFYIMVMRNFMYSIPMELEESAYLDGANEVTIAFRILLPLSKPIIATIALWAAVFYWNEWFQAMIYIRTPEKQVMQVLLRRIILESQLSSLFDDSSMQLAQTEDSVKAATMFVTIGPIIAIYPFLQKYFIKGLMTGSVKG